MLEVSVTRKIPAGEKEVWTLLEDFGRLGEWAIPKLEKVEVIGAGVGMIRRAFVTGFEPVDEKLESLDPVNKTLSYSIAKCSLLPYESYLADISVRGDSRCTEITWHSVIGCGNIPEPEVRTAVETGYNNLIDGLQAHLLKTSE